MVFNKKKRLWKFLSIHFNVREDIFHTFHIFHFTMLWQLFCNWNLWICFVRRQKHNIIVILLTNYWWHSITYLFFYYLFSTCVWAISLCSTCVCICINISVGVVFLCFFYFISDGPIKWQFDIEWSNKLLFFLISLFLCHHQQFIF